MHMHTHTPRGWTRDRIRALHDVVVVGPRLAGDVRLRRVAFIDSATYAAMHVCGSLADARKRPRIELLGVLG
jgi:hypothetical protein